MRESSKKRQYTQKDGKKEKDRFARKGRKIC